MSLECDDVFHSFLLVHYINTSTIKYTSIVHFFILCSKIHLNTNICYIGGRLMCSQNATPCFTFKHMEKLALNYARSSGTPPSHKMQLYCTYKSFKVYPYLNGMFLLIMVSCNQNMQALKGML